MSNASLLQESLLEHRNNVDEIFNLDSKPGVPQEAAKLGCIPLCHQTNACAWWM